MWNKDCDIYKLTNLAPTYRCPCHSVSREIIRPDFFPSLRIIDRRTKKTNNASGDIILLAADECTSDIISALQSPHPAVLLLSFFLSSSGASYSPERERWKKRGPICLPFLAQFQCELSLIYKRKDFLISGGKRQKIGEGNQMGPFASMTPIRWYECIVKEGNKNLKQRIFFSPSPDFHPLSRSLSKHAESRKSMI